MNRTDIINHIIKKLDAKKYLEIGVSDGQNFKDVKCEYKVGVDPEPTTPATHHMASDDFFIVNQEKFDVVFVDGLHTQEQVYRDIINALEVVGDKGIVVCHDMNPEKEEHQVPEYTRGIWNGDCWKALVQLRTSMPGLYVFTVDTDYGCAVIQKNPGEISLKINKKIEDLTFQDLMENRKEYLNLVAPEFFYDAFAENNLRDLTKSYILDPNNPEKNWKMATYYDNIDQTAAAVSFYIRTAERTEDELLKYECMIRAAMCFERQGTRKFTVKGLLQHAVSTQPLRPEGYYLLSMFYETETQNDGRWFDSYMMASMALEICDFENLKPLRTEVAFPGKYSLLFQKAHTAWWCGLGEDARKIFLDLYANYDMNEYYKNLTYENLLKLNAFVSKGLNLYKKKDYERLIYKFKGAEDIEQNYSEAYQDMFVLSSLNGKRNGTYLEIGSGHPTYGNNTYLLEKEFGWNGVSLDISEDFVSAHNNERSHTCINKDAAVVNYDTLLNSLGFEGDIDYLQIDCDPPEVSFKALLSIPFEKRNFSVITFEHDHYTDPQGNYREKAFNYLESHGYIRVAENISPDENRPYEGWYIHESIFKDYKGTIRCDQKALKAEHFMLKKDS